MELTLLTVIRDFSIAFVVGFCWAILFGSPKKMLWVAGLLGGTGHCFRFILLQLGFEMIPSTLAASLLIGFCGIYLAHQKETPTVVLTMPACITMIPGVFAYRAMLNGIKLTDKELLQENLELIPNIAHNLVLTVSLLFTLAIGICVGALLARRTSPRYDALKKDR